jgi:hypothetical protein
MVIRTAQLDTLSDLREQQFEQRVADHLARCFPDQCARTEPAALQEIVEESLEKARGYGFESEWELVRYLDLVMVFGRDFEKLPACSKVAGHLQNTELNNRTRITFAYAAAHDVPAGAPEAETAT